MPRYLTVFFLIVCFCTTVYGAEPSLEAVVEGYSKAIGSATKLQNVRSYILRARSSSGDGSNKRPYIIYCLRPNMFRSEYYFQPGLAAITAYDGKKAWSIQPWTGSNDPQESNKDDADQLARGTEILHNDLVTWRQTGAKLSLVGQEEIEGSLVYKVRADRKDGAAIEYYVDADSYLIIRAKTYYKASGVETEQSVFFTNYKTYDGLLLPSTFEYKDEGAIGWTWTIEKLEMNSPLDASLFTMPESKGGAK